MQIAFSLRAPDGELQASGPSWDFPFIGHIIDLQFPN